MEEFKDECQNLEVRIEELAMDLRDLPTDYKIAERYNEIDQEIYEISEWYERVKRERKVMEERLKNAKFNLRVLDHEVKNIKLREFSRAQHGGSYSQLLQTRHP